MFQYCFCIAIIPVEQHLELGWLQYLFFILLACLTSYCKKRPSRRSFLSSLILPLLTLPNLIWQIVWSYYYTKNWWTSLRIIIDVFIHYTWSVYLQHNEKDLLEGLFVFFPSKVRELWAGVVLYPLGACVTKRQRFFKSILWANEICYICFFCVIWLLIAWKNRFYEK